MYSTYVCLFLLYDTAKKGFILCHGRVINHQRLLTGISNRGYRAKIWHNLLCTRSFCYHSFFLCLFLSALPSFSSPYTLSQDNKPISFSVLVFILPTKELFLSVPLSLSLIPTVCFFSLFICHLTAVSEVTPRYMW